MADLNQIFETTEYIEHVSDVMYWFWYRQQRYLVAGCISGTQSNQTHTDDIRFTSITKCNFRTLWIGCFQRHFSYYFFFFFLFRFSLDWSRCYFPYSLCEWFRCFCCIPFSFIELLDYASYWIITSRCWNTFFLFIIFVEPFGNSTLETTNHN